VYGGAQSIHTNGFDEALALPTERSATLALRTQQILMHEAGTTATADPLGGSWYVESLTDALEAEARELIDRIDELGGAVVAIEAGWVQEQIEEAAFAWQREVESGERVIVGVNRFTSDEPERVELHVLDAAIERAQRDRVQALRAARDAAAVEAAMAEVRRIADGEGNLLPPLRDALAARATVGELCGTLRELWGTYDAR